MAINDFPSRPLPSADELRRFYVGKDINDVPRLATVAREVGESSVSVMIDHPDQLVYLNQFHEKAGFAAGVFLKVDTGYHRAGVPPTMLNKNGLLEKIAEEEKAGRVTLLGVYSHSSLSYAATNPEEAMSYLKTEIAGCKEALQKNSHLLPTDRELVISVGATPQAISAHNLLQEPLGPKAKDLQAFMQSTTQNNGSCVKIELHAGVYTVMDMQQMATRAKHLGNIEDEVALSVVAEVCSVYNNGERDKPEALVAAGTLALGREPCQSYPGWGIVGNLKEQSGTSRLIVERISQEHGIVSWHGGDGSEIPLRVGQFLRIYPNHACITGALYGWYLIVDSGRKGEETKIVDVWVRWPISMTQTAPPATASRPSHSALPNNREYPRVLLNVRQIRKVEVVLDSRDYIYMTQFLADELPAVANVMDQLITTVSESIPTAVDALRVMHADFESEDDDPAHRQHIENMNEYFWGRLLTVLRQAFKLSHFYVDLSRCTCVDGCCRLADERFHRGSLLENVVDLDRMIDVRKLGQYNDALREIHLEIDHIHDDGPEAK
ncbi:putative serine dehydratase domain-containing protein [Aspergillus floccosus]